MLLCLAVPVPNCSHFGGKLQPLAAGWCVDLSVSVCIFIVGVMLSGGRHCSLAARHLCLQLLCTAQPWPVGVSAVRHEGGNAQAHLRCVCVCVCIGCSHPSAEAALPCAHCSLPLLVPPVEPLLPSLRMLICLCSSVCGDRLCVRIQASLGNCLWTIKRTMWGPS